MRYEEVFGEEAVETTSCWNCGGEVVLGLDECGDTCAACVDEEVAISRETRRRVALGDCYYEEVGA